MHSGKISKAIYIIIGGSNLQVCMAKRLADEMQTTALEQMFQDFSKI